MNEAVALALRLPVELQYRVSDPHTAAGVKELSSLSRLWSACTRCKFFSLFEVSLMWGYLQHRWTKAEGAENRTNGLFVFLQKSHTQVQRETLLCHTHADAHSRPRVYKYTMMPSSLTHTGRIYTWKPTNSAHTVVSLRAASPKGMYTHSFLAHLPLLASLKRWRSLRWPSDHRLRALIIHRVNVFGQGRLLIGKYVDTKTHRIMHAQTHTQTHKYTRSPTHGTPPPYHPPTHTYMD